VTSKFPSCCHVHSAMVNILSFLLIVGIYITSTSPTPVSVPISPTTPTESHYTTWQAEPDGRGTFSIIFSCLTTLLFCASKLLKPNILPSRWRGRWIQLAQIVAGMFVPEIVYVMALGQFCDAKGIRDTVNRKAEEYALRKGIQSQDAVERHWWMKRLWRWFIFEQEPQYIRLVPTIPSSSIKNKTTALMSRIKGLPDCRQFERWTLVHGFYATMGGFQMDISDLDSERQDTRHLRPHVLLDLADKGEFHRLNIVGADLIDKSKFDVLGSTVAFVQALWFCAQSIARVRQGLAISLLEISTIAHVTLSAFTLILWWPKPQSVNRGHIILHQPKQPRLEQGARYERILQRSNTENQVTVERKENYFFANRLGRSKYTARQARRALKHSAWREALSESPFLSGRGESLWMFHIDQPRSMRDRWFPYSLYFWATAAFWAPVALFGAIHVAAWNAHFPSSTERILWLVASILISITSLAYGFGTMVVYWFGPRRWRDFIPSSMGPPVRYGHLQGCLAVGAHVYLFLASWIGLRSLPASAFQTVDWTAAFPHLS